MVLGVVIPGLTELFYNSLESRGGRSEGAGLWVPFKVNLWASLGCKSVHPLVVFNGLVCSLSSLPQPIAFLTFLLYILTGPCRVLHLLV